MHACMHIIIVYVHSLHVYIPNICNIIIQYIA